ncbi:MAG: protein translocase subunit SecD, partial [Pseudomonadota bacterium]
MTYIPLWKRVLVITTILLSFAYCLPNLVGSSGREWLTQNLPSWMPTKSVSLGLDLQGGSYILLQADIAGVVKQHTEDAVAAIRTDLRKENIAFKSVEAVESGIKIVTESSDKIEDVRNIVRKTDPTFVLTSDQNILSAMYDEKALKTIRDQTMAQSIEIVNRRVNESGTKEPIIQRQGDDRILVQLPGINDPEQVKHLLGKTAKLTFHLVSMSDDDPSVRKVPMRDNPTQLLPLNRRPLLTGDMLDSAHPDFQDGAPVVSFRLNAVGARRFCEVTHDNIGKPFAVVLDNEIITAPRINDAICGGSAVISGSFTTKESAELAVLLRAGALPTSLAVIEERSVGPSLGNDSVEAGKTATIGAFILIVAFMILSYDLFGVFASIALFINMVMIISLLSVLQATLTLPGIAGIILTMGMAVDANVLIFERIREEFRSGRSIVSAMDTGFEKAMSSIIDSNLTTLISGIVLYVVGTGPIKGFAVTMSMGIL